MGRKKLEFPRIKIHIDGWLPAEDELLKALLSLPRGHRFKTVVRWLKMGKAMEAIQPAVSDEELRQQVQAAQDIANSFVFEE